MPDVPGQAIQAADRLTSIGAAFVLLVGSHARGAATDRSDVDVAAHFGGAGSRILRQALGQLPPGVDLLVLDTAPAELAGRAALEGIVLRQRDPVARVRWVADTRKRYLDEQDRISRSRADFVAARAASRTR
jgi:predicted nucleotidyltransferase